MGLKGRPSFEMLLRVIRITHREIRLYADHVHSLSLTYILLGVLLLPRYRQRLTSCWNGQAQTHLFLVSPIEA
jgi:hypothetical protein